MASHPPGACCTIGVKHEGSAVGEVKKINDFRVYFSYPKDKSTHNAILLMTDVIGMDFINVQLIADQFAANGYFVVMPDLFNGDTVKLNPPEGFQIFEWLKSHLAPTVDPILEATLKEMRGSLGCKKIGGVGYCFGGKYVCRFLKEGKLDAGYTAHPSFVDKEELEGCEGPLSIAAAETDQVFPAAKRRETEDILLNMKIPYQINLFSDVVHGFAVKADLSNRRIKFAKEQAFLQAVHWFDEYVKGSA
ncbi:alpha/beta-hydrolase [Lindgomyces ingoldianus]|uniref:Alpha/beta-hydrolase n=1 Tax=Lindgomyces ingoldianus TaxID=673940 RepID=A0ACB6RFR6_9PLEO|nr:alpha/beta-hydrolase [Lindgomyces ingoldianus]KAF2478189.1 alpha/beta-hydrolase [Lindgomyces ingoldianus]